MKRAITLLLFAAALALTGCGEKPVETIQTTTETEDITLTSDIKPSSTPLDSLEYIPVTDIEEKYITERTEEIIYFNSLAAPVELDGLKNPADNGGVYYRLDYSKSDLYLDELDALAYTLPSVQLRFATDAKEVKIRIHLRNDNPDTLSYMSGFAMRGVEAFIGTGSALDRVGHFDVLLGEDRLYNEGRLPISKEGGLNEVTIDLPLMAGIEYIELGLAVDAKIAAPTPRDYGAVCFYGSSITHGICANSAGNNYPSVVCRALNADCWNLGFMGLAQGEIEVADFIGELDIAAFVFDYDHNANSRVALEATHYPFYQRVRELQPDIPIILMSRPYFSQEPTQTDLERRAVIEETYRKAVAAGDNNVYLIDAESYFPKENRDLYSTDNLHPNDLGYYSMARAVYPTLKKALDAAK